MHSPKQIISARYTNGQLLSCVLNVSFETIKDILGSLSYICQITGYYKQIAIHPFPWIYNMIIYNRMSNMRDTLKLSLRSKHLEEYISLHCSWETKAKIWGKEAQITVTWGRDWRRGKDIIPGKWRKEKVRQLAREMKIKNKQIFFKRLKFQEKREKEKSLKFS